MSVFDDEVLTIVELASFLKLKRQTLYRWAQKGKIPGAKIGKEWRFRRSVVEEWMRKAFAGGDVETAGENGNALRQDGEERKIAPPRRRPRSGPEKS